jgi:tetratricopeptide (TPR) repeat protein/predicted Ser/Thr protein kinase
MRAGSAYVGRPRGEEMGDSGAVSGERPVTSQVATRTDEDGPPSVTGRAGRSPAGEPAGQATPTQVGRFVVLRKLGEGGMGVVYAAYDEELERKVAIKLLRGEFKGQRQSVGQARLLREAQAMARLSHPNIAQVYEVGKHDSAVYLAMEFVHGCNLREWHEQAARPWQTVLATYFQAGHGLAAARAGGIVHRDFKPDNALIGEDGRVRVVDFGLARPGDAALEDVPAGVSATRMVALLTQAGSFVGTPAYMAPEQLMREPADARSDQFSFCVALFEGLYGARPFAGNDTASLRDAVLDGEPGDPPRDTQVPGWVHRALLRGLSREPQRRFADMHGLLAALAADPSARRRRRLGLAGVVLGAGLAAGGGGVVVYELRAASAAVCAGSEGQIAEVWGPEVAATTRAALVGTGVGYAEDVAARVLRRLDEYTAEWAAMRREACETHRQGEQSDALFDRRMACLDERRTAARALVQVLAVADADVVEKAVQAADHLPPLARCADAAALLVERSSPADPETIRAVERLLPRLATAQAKLAVGQFKAALAEAQQLAGEAEALAAGAVVADIQLLAGVAADEIGDYKAAEAALVRAIAAADGAGEDDRRAQAQVELVRVVGLHQGRLEEGLRHAELTRGTLARLADPGSTEAGLEARLSELFLTKGDVDRAAAHVERSIALHRESHGERSPQFAFAIDKRGTLQFYRGDLPGALIDYRTATRILEEHYGAHHPVLGRVLNNVGAVELTMFDNDAAEATFRRAREILRGAHGETHPSLGSLHSNLGMIAVHQGRAAQAVEEFRRALAIYEAHLPADHPAIGSCLVELGNALLHAGDAAAAQQAYARALAVFTGNPGFGVGHAKTTLALASLGAAQLRAGDAAAAERSFARALAEFRGPADDPELGATYAGLGALDLARGAFAAAIPRLEQAIDRLSRSPSAAPFQVAEVQFALARALQRQAPPDLPRARSLADSARQNYTRVGAGFRAQAAEIETWLAQLPTG